MQEQEAHNASRTKRLGTEQEDTEDTMATLGRSLKSPSYFSRARGPALTRTLSNSSEVSATSANPRRSDDYFDFVMSDTNTPAQEESKHESLAAAAASSQDAQHLAPRAESASKAATLKSMDKSSSLKLAKLSQRRPIAIELPQARKFGSASNYTPPEPLSVHGDRPGAYFPYHADPKTQIYHLQPCYSSNTRSSRKPHPTINLPHDSPVPFAYLAVSLPVATPEATPLFAVDSSGSSITPVVSYIPSGAHETSLPMGKYYPSNYERTCWPPTSLQSQPLQSSPEGLAGLPSSIKSDSRVLVPPSAGRQEPQDIDARRKLQQYQRDMIAQARVAASEVLHNVRASSTSNSTSATATITLNGVLRKNLRQFGASALHELISPRLLPLGSPGPVTPMDLEGGDSR